MLAFRINFVPLVTMLTALVVVSLICFDVEVENTFDFRLLVVRYGGGAHVCSGGVRVYGGGFPYDKSQGY